MKLVIKVMWCKGLTSFNFFQKLKLYAIASIKSDNKKLKLTHHQKQQQKTPVDEEGGSNPEWNHTMTFDVSRLESNTSSFDDLLLFFVFRHHQLVGFKTVGEVQVPLRHLIEHGTNENVKFVSYEVRNPEGKHNGALDFSYEVIRNDDFHINHGSHSHHHHHHHRRRHHHNSEHIDRKHDAQTDTTASECHHTHQANEQKYQLVQQSWSNPDKITYPKIDLEDLSDILPTYSSPIVTNIGHYPTPVTAYQLPAELQWDPTPPIRPHFPPPLPSPSVVYLSPQYGYPLYEDPHCGYYRPPEYNHINQHG